MQNNSPAAAHFGLLVVVGLLIAGLLSTGGGETRDARLERVSQEIRTKAGVPEGTFLGVVLQLPPELRTKNWGGGSCVHASNVNLLKWNGLAEEADWWRKTYSGGEYDERLIKRMESAGLRFAYANGGQDRDGDGQDDGEQFIDWCVRTRRAAGIFYKPSHSINLAGMDEQYAYLLDNNATDYPERQGHYERVPRAEFFRRWHGYGGFAWTLVYVPPPPAPFAAAPASPSLRLVACAPDSERPCSPSWRLLQALQPADRPTRRSTLAGGDRIGG